MADEIKIIDVAKKLIEVSTPQKRVFSKDQLLKQKAVLQAQIARLDTWIAQCP